MLFLPSSVFWEIWLYSITSFNASSLSPSSPFKIFFTLCSPPTTPSQYWYMFTTARTHSSLSRSLSDAEQFCQTLSQRCNGVGYEKESVRVLESLRVGILFLSHLCIDDFQGDLSSGGGTDVCLLSVWKISISLLLFIICFFSCILIFSFFVRFSSLSLYTSITSTLCLSRLFSQLYYFLTYFSYF